jgi:soluble lytic murein transglycosylase
MVDWIESIPFNETRTYVQRVLENLQVYRGQNTENAAAFSLAADLAR